MDFNGFEFVHKTGRRLGESVSDTVSFVEHSLLQVGCLQDFGVARNANAEQIKAANIALDHNDTKEAEHQLSRALVFSGTIDELAGSRNEVSAVVGLQSLKKGNSADRVKKDMEMAFFAVRADEPYRGTYQRFEETMTDLAAQKQKDPMTWWEQTRRVSFEYDEDRKSHSPKLKEDAFRLAIMDLGSASAEVFGARDGGGAAIFIKQAKRDIQTAKQLGADTRKLEEFARRLRLMLPVADLR